MTDSEPVVVRDLPPVRLYRVDEIHEHESNPRVIPPRAVELVALSLRRFGWKQPLVIAADGDVVVGHTRLRAARSLGLRFVPGISADDLTPEEVDAYRIADNRTRDFTSWDLPALADQLEALSGDFADVLALADWEAVAADLERLNGGGGSGLGTLDLPGDVADALDGGFILTVHFHSKEDALAAEETIINLPGAFDVRHDF